MLFLIDVWSLLPVMCMAVNSPDMSSITTHVDTVTGLWTGVAAVGRLGPGMHLKQGRSARLCVGCMMCKVTIQEQLVLQVRYVIKFFVSYSCNL